MWCGAEGETVGERNSKSLHLHTAEPEGSAVAAPRGARHGPRAHAAACTRPGPLIARRHRRTGPPAPPQLAQPHQPGTGTGNCGTGNGDQPLACELFVCGGA